MKIGDVIASYRRRKRLDQKEMAGDLGITPSYLSQIENNSRTANVKLLSKIAEKLDVPVSALLFETLDESNFKDEKNKEIFQQAKPLMEQMIALLLDENAKS